MHRPEPYGRTVRIDVLRPDTLHCSATHFTADDLFAADHETELAPRRELVVHLDVAHRGLGTASCGPDVLPAVPRPAGGYRFAYRLSPAIIAIDLADPRPGRARSV